MIPQVLEETCHILLCRRHQDALAPLNEFGKGLQVVVVRLTGKRPQPLLHPKVDLVILQQRKIAGAVHTPDYLRSASIPNEGRATLNLVYQESTSSTSKQFDRRTAKRAVRVASRDSKMSGRLTRHPVAAQMGFKHALERGAEEAVPAWTIWPFR